MQDSKETRKPNRGQFGWLYKVLCQERQVKPLPAIQAYLKEECLRFCVDRIGLKDWSPLLNSIADNRSLKKIYIYSRSRCRQIREKVNTEEKLEKLW
ncbi:centrosomal protein of 78 kDa-like [Calliopsis andreniformis]|uniref:centrosomal protein of 78 kDa-like n=1 Tax=Calliopsis andreniformis TaxID=337506 RepID=UPI003FCDA9C0